MISVKHLNKTFSLGTAPVHALRDVSLDIADGEYVIITGRSGAGKSTLLYHMGLLDTPTSGSIEIDSIRADTMTDAERTDFRLRRLGYVFQSYALLPELTALENVLVPLLMDRQSRFRNGFPCYGRVPHTPRSRANDCDGHSRTQPCP
jgi:putative ABC transport system ATP-binding protein